MSERKTEGLSPEKALLMEIALELLGNKVFDVYGAQQDSFVDLFRENDILSYANTLHTTTSHQSSSESLRPFPTRLIKADSIASSPGAFHQQLALNQAMTDGQQSFQDPEKAAVDREFVETMMKKIDKEYNNLMRISHRLKQTYFTDFWLETSTSAQLPSAFPWGLDGDEDELPEPPELSENDIENISDEYYLKERTKLEEMWKEQRDAIIQMKTSAATPRETEAVKIVTRNITLVKNRLEKSIQNQEEQRAQQNILDQLHLRLK